MKPYCDLFHSITLITQIKTFIYNHFLEHRNYVDRAVSCNNMFNSLSAFIYFDNTAFSLKPVQDRL